MATRQTRFHLIALPTFVSRTTDIHMHCRYAVGLLYCITTVSDYSHVGLLVFLMRISCVQLYLKQSNMVASVTNSFMKCWQPSIYAMCFNYIYELTCDLFLFVWDLVAQYVAHEVWIVRDIVHANSRITILFEFLLNVVLEFLKCCCSLIVIYTCRQRQLDSTTRRPRQSFHSGS